jgi:hypothetical protein
VIEWGRQDDAPLRILWLCSTRRERRRACSSETEGHCHFKALYGLQNLAGWALHTGLHCYSKKNSELILPNFETASSYIGIGRALHCPSCSHGPHRNCFCKCLFSRVPGHGRFIACNACFRRDIPWELRCWGTR